MRLKINELQNQPHIGTVINTIPVTGEERPYPHPKPPFTAPPLILRKISPDMSNSPMAGNTVSRAKSEIHALSAALSASMKKPTRRTLSLIDRALSYLLPFESAKATVTSSTEKSDLMALLALHRTALAPYADIDRIEHNLKIQRCHP